MKTVQCEVLKTWSRLVVKDGKATTMEVREGSTIELPETRAKKKAKQGLVKIKGLKPQADVKEKE